MHLGVCTGFGCIILNLPNLSNLKQCKIVKAALHKLLSDRLIFRTGLFCLIYHVCSLCPVLVLTCEGFARKVKSWSLKDLQIAYHVPQSYMSAYLIHQPLNDASLSSRSVNDKSMYRAASAVKGYETSIPFVNCF